MLVEGNYLLVLCWYRQSSLRRRIRQQLQRCMELELEQTEGIEKLPQALRLLSLCSRSDLQLVICQQALWF
jgi:hypothetical protein